MKNIEFIICNIQREKEIIDMVKNNVNFFKENKIRFTWPERILEEEYDSQKYKKYKNWIELEWDKKENGFVEKLISFFRESSKLKFIIEISNYGPMGFYNAKKNKITINLNNQNDPVLVIMHEMVHIMIEPFIKKYSISHNKKELIVNTILNFLKK